MACCIPSVCVGGLEGVELKSGFETANSEGGILCSFVPYPTDTLLEAPIERQQCLIKARKNSRLLTTPHFIAGVIASAILEASEPA